MGFWGDVGKWGLAAGTLGIMPASVAAAGWAGKQLSGGGGGDGLSWGDVPLIGGFLGESRADKAAAQKAAAMRRAADHYANYRPIQMQQHQNSLASQMAALKPMNNALGQMYGPGVQLDMDQILQSPVVDQDLWPARMPEAAAAAAKEKANTDRARANYRAAYRATGPEAVEYKRKAAGAAYQATGPDQKAKVDAARKSAKAAYGATKGKK